MSFSVNTNFGAAIALQNLAQTNRDLSVTQNRIGTGFKVASAKDDAATFNIAQGLRGDLGSLNAIKGSLDRAKSAVDVGVSAAETVSDLLNRMGELAVAAEDSSLDADSLASIQTDFDNLVEQIDTVVEQATFNGTNMVQATPDSVTALAGIEVAAAGDPLPSIDVAGADLSAAGLAVDALTLGGGVTAREAIDAAKTTVANALSELGAGAKQLEIQTKFVAKLSDTIESGIGNLVDADMAKESARLQALQIKTQLGIQALSIANQAPQAILGLFR
jgi:flagellin